MNIQKPTSANHIEWTRRKMPDGTRLPGYTWNPIGGCRHRCRWRMPDGKIAICYAEKIAEIGVAQSAFPHGFGHHYWRPHLLEEPLKLKTPAGIFLDSMSDLFGHWVPDGQIEAVLDTVRRADWHTFFSLTKNAPRMYHFECPPNLWLGASSPPDFMWGKELNPSQKQAMLELALITLNLCSAARPRSVQWMSFEPLSFEVAETVARYPQAIQWAVIGAASDGPRYHPPREGSLRRLIEVLDGQCVPVFFKGNLRSLPWAWDHWREEFPMGRA